MFKCEIYRHGKKIDEKQNKDIEVLKSWFSENHFGSWEHGRIIMMFYWGGVKQNLSIASGFGFYDEKECEICGNKSEEDEIENIIIKVNHVNPKAYGYPEVVRWGKNYSIRKCPICHQKETEKLAYRMMNIARNALLAWSDEKYRTGNAVNKTDIMERFDLSEDDTQWLELKEDPREKMTVGELFKNFLEVHPEFKKKKIDYRPLGAYKLIIWIDQVSEGKYLELVVEYNQENKWEFISKKECCIT